LHELLEEAAGAIAGRPRVDGLETVRLRYPHLHALIEEAAGPISGGPM
jgi:hypothetical protein